MKPDLHDIAEMQKQRAAERAAAKPKDQPAAPTTAYPLKPTSQPYPLRKP